MTFGGLLLPAFRKVTDAFHISDNTGEVVQVVAFAYGALLQVMLVDMSATVAHRVGNVEGEIVATLLNGHPQQLLVLRFAQVFVQIHAEIVCRNLFAVPAAEPVGGA